MDTFRTETVFGGTNLVIRGLGLSAPSPTSREIGSVVGGSS